MKTIIHRNKVKLRRRKRSMNINRTVISIFLFCLCMKHSRAFFPNELKNNNGTTEVRKEKLFLKPGGKTWTIFGYACWDRNCLQKCIAVGDAACRQSCVCKNPRVYYYTIYSQIIRELMTQKRMNNIYPK